MSSLGFTTPLGIRAHVSVKPKELRQFGAYAPDALYGIATVSILFGCGCLIYHKVKKEIDSQYRIEGKSETPQPAPAESGDKDSNFWENFNDAVYNHSDQVFKWLLGNVFLSGSINLLIGPKSQGKTLLVTQMMDAIAKGKPLELFVSERNKPFSLDPQDVFLVVLEMQYAQLCERNGKHGYMFKNIHRSTCQTYSIDSYLKQCRELVQSLTKPASVFVDNITRFISDITQPTIAKKLYDGIKDIRDEAKKRGIDITFVLVAHTSNDWSMHKPINISSIAVADTLTTGMDSIWAIGPTRNYNQKLFKLVTARNIPEPDEVVILERTDEPFLCFKIVGTAAEDDVLPTRKSASDSGDKGNRPKGSKKDVNDGVKFPGGFSLSDMEKIFEENQSGSTLRELEKKWEKSTTTINNAIKKYEEYLAQTNSTKSNSEKPLDDYFDYEEVE